MKKKKILLIVFFTTTLLCSCKFMKEVDVTLSNLTETDIESFSEETKDELTGEIISIQQVNVDVGTMTETFLGLSLEEAEPYIVLSPYDDPNKEITNPLYEIGTKSLICTENMFVFYDYIDNAGDCYESMILSNIYLNPCLTEGMRSIFPLEDIDTCSREEAIAFCQPYAEACGYLDADISVYAMTLESLENISEKFYNGHTAPQDGLHIMMRREYWEKVEAGEMTEEEMSELRYPTSFAPWEKKHEAMLLVYRPYINGLIMDSQDSQILIIVYAPYYNGIVFAEGYVPNEELEVSSVETLISKEKAVSKLITSIGANSQEDIMVSNISLVYSARSSRANLALPCWRIDYTYPEHYDNMGINQYTILIDAVDGQVSKFY